MTEHETAWLAGLIEGEGCFSLKRTPMIQLSMTDEDVIARVATLWGKPYHSYQPRAHQNKRVFATIVHGEKAIKIMLAILPFMGERRSARILEVIALARARPGVAKGERAGCAKLTDAQADEIRASHIKGSRRRGIRSSDLARRYGISQSALWYVIHKRQRAA